MNPDQTAPKEQSDLGPYCLQYSLPNNKSSRALHLPLMHRLLFSSSEMFKKPLWQQTVWTHIRLLL